MTATGDASSTPADAQPSLPTVVAARGIGKQIGDVQILTDIGFSIVAGESVAIVGGSGSGKSTLLSLLAGLDTPSAGEAWLAGQRIDNLDEDGRAARRAGTVGFVFQSFQLLPTMTALENVMLPLEIVGAADAEQRARDWLVRVGLAHRIGHYPRELSGGEQQRVAIARAFAVQPRILFADEPTGNLDTRTGAQIADLLFAMNRESGTTLLLVTHEARLAERCARRLHLDAGRLVSDSSAGVVSNNSAGNNTATETGSTHAQ